jgi:hypothetical protein
MAISAWIRLPASRFRNRSRRSRLSIRVAPFCQGNPDNTVLRPASHPKKDIRIDMLP